MRSATKSTKDMTKDINRYKQLKTHTHRKFVDLNSNHKLR